MFRRSATAALTAAALTIAGAGVAGATSDARDNRLAGPDRYTTARAVAEATFQSATIALLASGEDFADALAATYISGASGAPLLLTTQGALPAGTIDTLEALEIDGVLIIGGPAAVSGDVAVELENAGYTTSRVQGVNRYETAREIAEVFAPEAIGEFEEGRAAIIATGENFPDALAAGPMSSFQGMPILLTTGDSLHPQARAGLEGLGIQQTVIVGGTAAVSSLVESQIQGMGIGVRRVAGTTRQETAREMAEVLKGELQFPIDRVILARGDAFPDALAGGTRGGWVQAPILLVQNPQTLGDEAESFIFNNKNTIAVVDVLGGTAAVNQSVVARAVAVARS